jgi:5-methyltetrahydrofolate--homocysteine methyltransferase
MLAARPHLLADGATGTNLFHMGLTSGDAPELWNEEHPDRIKALYRQFVDAGADIILTNSFGGNRRRLALHKADARTHEINRRAAALAREVADAAGRPVVVAGSVGPTGELFAPLGPLTDEEAIGVFAEQIEGLKAGGADVIWIETMSALEEMRAAAMAAVRCGMPYTVTASFDTAGRTMMGITPQSFAETMTALEPPPLAIGANCGAGASDTLASILAMTAALPGIVVISKANAGIPKYHDGHIHYSGTPELMAAYAGMAIDAGARIVGGCCGTSPEHLAGMRRALDAHVGGPRPDHEAIQSRIGPFVHRPAPAEAAGGKSGQRRRRG